MNHWKAADAAMQNTCVAFGSFDGVHLGHRAIVAEMLRHAGATPVVVSFETPDQPVLYSEDEKAVLLEELGVDTLVSYPAAEAQAMEPAAFVKDVLVKKLGAKVIVVGKGFVFGKDGAGDVALLQQLAGECGYELTVCEPVLSAGEVVSAGAIFAAFEAKDFARATELFGHTYMMLGVVVHGKAEGRKVGMPTANLGIPDNKQYPPHGVYATISTLDGEKRRGLTNIGLRPSADTMPHATVETFLLNFKGDLYGKPMRLDVHLYVRGVVKFANLEAVKEQVNKDIEHVHEYLEQIGL
ncbi:MAG: riboflavin kinase [Ruthenibacterium sp.]